MSAKCNAFLEITASMLKKLEPLPPLLARLTTGWIFAESGWGKFQHLPKVVSFFAELGIPAPQIQAPFVAGVELVGGAFLIIGFCTRIVSIPLAATMVVAILTAKKESIESLSDFLGMSEYLYIALLFWLAIYGAGCLSIDHWLRKLCCHKDADKK